VPDLHLSGPPARPSGRPAPLLLRALRHRTFGPRPPDAEEPRRAVYFGDLLRQWGLRFDESRYAAAPRNGFAAMAAAVIDDLDPGGEVDLLVLAHATPDCAPWVATASLVGGRLPGRPLALAVSDQGSAAGFTALRLACDRVRAGQCGRAVVVLLDQSTVDFHTPRERSSGPVGDHAVALLIEPCGSGGGIATLAPVRQWADVPPERIGSLLSTMGGDMFVGPPGQPCTGPWAALPAALGRGRSALIVDYEPALRYLSAVSVLAGDRDDVVDQVVQRR
jgi:hypothetical protein